MCRRECPVSRLSSRIACSLPTEPLAYVNIGVLWVALNFSVQFVCERGMSFGGFRVSSVSRFGSRSSFSSSSSWFDGGSYCDGES